MRRTHGESEWCCFPCLVRAGTWMLCSASSTSVMLGTDKKGGRMSRSMRRVIDWDTYARAKAGVPCSYSYRQSSYLVCKYVERRVRVPDQSVIGPDLGGAAGNRPRHQRLEFGRAERFCCPLPTTSSVFFPLVLDPRPSRVAALVCYSLILLQCRRRPSKKLGMHLLSWSGLSRATILRSVS
jgi:hypothetical protein